MNMFPSSTSSSSQSSMDPTGSGGGGGLMRYPSAPGSLLSTAVDSVIGATREFGPQTHLAPPTFFSNSESSESTHKPNIIHNLSRPNTEDPAKTISLQRSYGFSGGGGGGGASSSSSLVRHSSSPAGFLNHLATAAGDNGFSITRGIGSSYNSKGMTDGGGGGGISRLNSQLSFTRPKEALSRISEETDNMGDGVGTDNGQRKCTHSYASAGGFAMRSWDDTDPLTFSVAPAKRAKTITNDIDDIESQFGLPQGALEMASMDKLLHIPQDSVPCKIRAKRGCATHPRSIAERERRTRISGKLKKLQDLVPNMDKQTSYADMLDLAVQHIKCLQNQVQKLNDELDCCTCGCKKTTG